MICFGLVLFGLLLSYTDNSKRTEKYLYPSARPDKCPVFLKLHIESTVLCKRLHKVRASVSDKQEEMH